MPDGAVDAVIDTGILAQVLNGNTPTYTGTLLLSPNAILSIGNSGGSEKAVTGVSTVTLSAGSELRWNINANLDFPPMVLAGNASWVTPFGASDHQTDNFSAITGAYALTINGFNNHTFNLNATNTFSHSITVSSGDSRYTAWAADILFTDNAGQRTFRGENEPGTDPLKPDTDGDGLLDGVETNTGVWVSASDTGSDPLNPDTDTDGLKDGVETHTGIFVSISNTGTHPLNPDTDGDGAGDWYEIYASFTDPFIASSKPQRRGCPRQLGHRIRRPRKTLRRPGFRNLRIRLVAG